MAPSERTLIVGIDYSDFCIPALDQALQISAQSPETRLVPLLALPQASPTHLQEAAATTDDFVARAQDNLVRLVQKRAQALGVSPGHVLPLVCFGDAAECLLDRARELRADLLLVGTHSRQGFGHLLMGSVAEEVVRKAGCSVLVARAQPSSPAAGVTGSDKRSEANQEDLAAAAAVGTSGSGVELLSEPHLDAGRVVLQVLDVASGQIFVCGFRDFSSLEVDPLERDWVPPPGAEERARVVSFALAEAGRDSARFTQLFEELTRRKRASSSDLAGDR